MARRGGADQESLSEAVKLLKAEYCVRAMEEHKMDYGLVFCRTKVLFLLLLLPLLVPQVDCDNLEQFLNARGGGRNSNMRWSIPGINITWYCV